MKPLDPVLVVDLFPGERDTLLDYFHIGEIATKRGRLGHRVGEYPGLLEECA